MLMNVHVITLSYNPQLWSKFCMWDVLSYTIWDTDSAAGHDADWHFLPSARLQYDFVFPMVLIWSWVIIIHQCPLSVQGFRAILIWRDRPQEIWSLKMLLRLWLLQVNQELESWFGNRIRYIISDINLQQKGAKTKTNQGTLLDPNIS